ncbi:unnamed protein product [Mytilus edulis]|uniref:Uncharacterized protein n=1 Tax=Mytilus edulis TaxID=6550 RepID=A0A8S3UVE7_MYTED|nr:unnamed protein product [Mytilus edulis]
MSVIYVDATVKMLNDKTCDVREDPISYIPIEYKCKFLGGSYLNAPKVAVHPLPSPAGSSGTIPNLNNFVPVVEITTDDHEEITKPVHVDQTTVDEISKPSSEKTTMKTSISSQQYGSTSTQHNVSSEPTGIDSENIMIFIHQLYNRPLNALPPPHGHLIPPPQQPVLQPIPQVQPAQQPQPVNPPPQIPPYQQPK